MRVTVTIQVPSSWRPSDEAADEVLEKPTAAPAVATTSTLAIAIAIRLLTDVISLVDLRNHCLGSRVWFLLNVFVDRHNFDPPFAASSARAVACRRLRRVRPRAAVINAAMAAAPTVT